MAKVICMPKIGVNMVDAVITKWLIQEGDSVASGQMIMTAETDKATQDIPVTESGKVARLIAKEMDRVDCQQPILILEEEGESLSQKELDQLVQPTKPEEKKPETSSVKPVIPAPQPVQTPAAAQGTSGRVKISPLAKKRAKELNIDFRLVPPSRPGARIVHADVERFAATLAAQTSAVQPSGAVQKAALSATRRTIAARMTESVQTKPAVALTLTVDASGLIAWRKASQKAGDEVRFNEMLVSISAKALHEFPIMNASMTGNEIEYHDDINIGVAVEYSDGLVVPKIFCADQKSTAQIRDDFAAKVKKIRNGQIDLNDISNGTFTITNLGMFGIEEFDAIINPPECAILAIGKMVERPVVRDGQIVIGQEMKLTLCFDHRIVDGAMAARFLNRIKQLAENPILML